MAVYARRPKLFSRGDDAVIMKVNDQVFMRANYLTGRGIPVLCGVPLVSQILEFSVDSQCSWFRLASTSICNDEELLIDLRTGALRSNSLTGFIIPIEEERIAEIIEESARPMTLTDAIESIKGGEVEDFGARSRFLWFGGNYKPVYLFLMEG